MHYLVEIIEKNFPDLLTFDDELPHVDKAAKISTESIQKTVYQMEVNLKNVQTDINNCRTLPKDDDDTFEEVMTVSFRVLRTTIELRIASSNVDSLCRNSRKTPNSNVRCCRICSKIWNRCSKT